MKIKLLLLSLLIIFSLSSMAQVGDFFHPIPKPASAVVGKGKASLASDNVMNAIRPIINVSSYGFSHGSGSLLTGAGVGLQHLKFNDATSKWDAIYSVNVLGWYTAPLSSSDGPTSAFAYGIAVGFFNNTVMIGGAYDTKNSIILPTIGLLVNLNN